jgi:drug/metabolite transporter (DMT)-like permease
MLKQVPQAFKIYGGIIIAEVICGIWPVVASLAIREGFDPLAFIFYRCFGAAALLSLLAWQLEGQLPFANLLPIFCLAGGHAKEADKPFPWREFLILGALTCTNMVGYIIGVAYTSSTQAALMQPVIPVMACLAGLASGTETINSGKLIGILMSVIGAMYLVYVGEEEAEDKSRNAGRRYQLGALALVVNVTSAAFFVVLQKNILRRYKPIFVSSATTAIATCYLMVLVLLYAEEFKFSSWRPWILTPRREAVLAYAIIFTTTVNFCILAWANKVTAPSTVTAFNTLQPLITAGTSAVWLGIVPHSRTVAGGIAILAGLILTVKAQLSDAALPERSSETASLI